VKPEPHKKIGQLPRFFSLYNVQLNLIYEFKKLNLKELSSLTRGPHSSMDEDITFASFGLAVLDEIRFPNREPLINVLGGSGAWGLFNLSTYNSIIIFLLT
jgi:hypothetical protein